MTEFSRRTGLWACGMALLTCAATSYGATVSLKAVKINDMDIAPTNTINAAPGDTIVAEVYWSGWGSARPSNDAQLRTFQAQIDAFGSYLRSDGAVMILPRGWDMPPIVPCTTNADCVGGDACDSACLVDNARACGRQCTNNFGCSSLCPDFPICAPQQYCVGTQHMPRSFNFMCSPNDNCGGTPPPRPDYCHNGISSLPVSDFAGINFRYAATSFDGTGTVDSGQSCYAGTLSMVLQPDACGTIDVRFAEGGDFTLFQDEFNFTFLPDLLEHLTINVANDCPVFVPSLVSAEPENCLVDARYPHSPSNQLPAFWFNPQFEFVLQFDAAPTTNGGVFQQGDFVVTQVPATLGTPTITSFVPDNTNVTVRFNRPALGTRWTCVRYQPCTNAGGTANECQACWGRLPGDVDGNLTVNANDLTALIGVVQSGSPADLVDCDLDRSGSCVAPDIIGWIDVFNGAGAFDPWGGQTLQACPSQ